MSATDNMADVLTVSPALMEGHTASGGTISREAVAMTVWCRFITRLRVLETDAAH